MGYKVKIKFNFTFYFIYNLILVLINFSPSTVECHISRYPEIKEAIQGILSALFRVPIGLTVKAFEPRGPRLN